MSIQITKDLLGKGPAFPFKRGSGGNFLMAEGEDLVAMGLEQAVLSEIGKRPMRKKKGDQIVRLLFSLQGAQRDSVADVYVRKAVNILEPRAQIVKVIVNDGEDDNVVHINIAYSVIGKQNIRNKVVPYWRV